MTTTTSTPTPAAPEATAGAASASTPTAAATTTSTNNPQTMEELLASSIDDFLLPASVVTRVAKTVMPGGGQITKDARTALIRACTVFINYLTATASDLTRAANLKTMTAATVFKALEVVEFDEFVPLLKSALDAHKLKQKQKRAGAAAEKKGDKGKAEGEGEGEGDEEEEHEEEDEVEEEEEEDADDHDQMEEDEEDAKALSRKRKSTAAQLSPRSKNARSDDDDDEVEEGPTTKKGKFSAAAMDVDGSSDLSEVDNVASTEDD